MLDDDGPPRLRSPPPPQLGRRFFSLLLFFGLFVLCCNNGSDAAAEECAGCKAYACMDRRTAHCGARGYLLAFGEPNCERFNTKDIYDRFDGAGKKFINCTGECLISEMEQYISSHKASVDCGALKRAAFAHHSVCYLRCGFCAVCKTNKLALLRAYRPADFGSADAIRQVFKVIRACGLISCLL